jgi:predicted site-specific integrase-resolvase
MNIQSNLLSQKKTADYFGVTVKTLISWRKAGIIKAIKINGLIRYHPDEIDRVLRENREQNRKPRRKYF